MSTFGKEDETWEWEDPAVDDGAAEENNAGGDGVVVCLVVNVR